VARRLRHSVEGVPLSVLRSVYRFFKVPFARFQKPSFREHGPPGTGPEQSQDMSPDLGVFRAGCFRPVSGLPSAAVSRSFFQPLTDWHPRPAFGGPPPAPALAPALGRTVPPACGFASMVPGGARRGSPDPSSANHPPAGRPICSETETPRLPQLSYDGTRRRVAGLFDPPALAWWEIPERPIRRRASPANTMFLKPYPDL